ncbi:hypothetical protein LXL04_025022 [Taraxacum kok-saghyz]
MIFICCCDYDLYVERNRFPTCFEIDFLHALKSIFLFSFIPKTDHKLPKSRQEQDPDKENLEAFTRMERAVIIHKTCFMLSLIMLQAICRANTNILKVGEELQKESLELQSGSRIYQLEGLRPNYWYGVKISYPASIPASFSLQLKKENLNLEPKHQRKLLNTEKLIFKNDDTQQSGIYVMLTVESEGVVAISHVKEREMVIYNIDFVDLYKNAAFNNYSQMLLHAFINYATSHMQVLSSFNYIFQQANTNILKVGEELQKESLQLHSGSRIYQLEGLTETCYIYQIPASFSLQLKKENSNFDPKPQRKLLNTEKLIFRNDDIQQFAMN